MADKVEHICEKNPHHWVEAKYLLTTCPIWVRGVPCNGDLKRVGKGSRTTAEVP